MKANRNWKPLFTWRAAIGQSDLPSTARLVAFAMGMYMSEMGVSAYPSAAELAQVTGLGISTVRQYRGMLEEEGWVICVRRGGVMPGGKHVASEYRAAIPPRAWAELEYTASRGQDLEAKDPESGGSGSRSWRGRVQTVDPNSSSNSSLNSMGETAPSPPKKESRGTRIPEPFTLTPDMKIWARTECQDVDVRLETKMFVDWARSASGSNAVKKDWERAWKNWMRREQKKAPRQPSR